MTATTRRRGPLVRLLEAARIAEVGRMAALMGPRKAAFLLSLAGCCVSPAVSRVVWALMDRSMVNAAIAGDLGVLVQAALFAALTFVLSAAVDPLFRMRYTRCVRHTMQDVRQWAFAAACALPMRYSHEHHSGDLISRMTHDAAAMESAYGAQIVPTIVTLVTGLSAGATMIVLDWRFALPLLVLGYLYLRANLAFAKPMRLLGDQIQEQRSRATQYLSDLIAGFRVLRMFRARGVLERYRREQDRVRATMIHRSRVGAARSVVEHVFSTACFVGVLVVGSFVVAGGQADFGSVVAIMGLQLSFNRMLLYLGNLVSELQVSLSGAARVFQLLDTRTEDPGQDKPGDVPDTGLAVEVRGLSFSYGEGQPVLRDLALEVERGSTVAIVGPSGCGKSTLLKLLLRFYDAPCGRIHVCGRPIGDRSLKTLRRQFAYVPQDAYVFDDTVEANIGFGRPGATAAAVREAARIAAAADFVEALTEGYGTQIGERGFKLSGGQRQRIALARAVLKDAPILLLDEATSALDAQCEEAVLRGLRQNRLGRTTIIVAHRLSTVQDADRIYVLDQGRVVQAGRHAELTASEGLYRRLYEAWATEAREG